MRRQVRTLRRLLLLVPVVLGVLTIGFAFLSTLPTSDRLAAYYGTPPSNAPWTYDPTMPAGAPGCSPPPHPDQLPGEETCPNPVYQHDVAALGLNEPVPVQWGVFVGLALTGHWGTVSLHDGGNLPRAIRGGSVASAVGEFLPYTLELAAAALGITYLLGVAFARGIWRRDSELEGSVARTGSFVPVFLVAIFAVAGGSVLLSALLGPTVGTPWCPSGEPTWSEVGGSWPLTTCFGGAYPAWLVSGFHSTPTGFPTLDAALHGQLWLMFDTLVRLVLPALVIAAATLGALVPGVRRRLAGSSEGAFVRAARALGLSEGQVAGAWSGRNVRRAVVLGLAESAALFVSALIIVESVFSLDGVGSLWVQSAILTNGELPDYGVFLGTFLALVFLALGIRFVFEALSDRLGPGGPEERAPPPGRPVQAPRGVEEGEPVRPLSPAVNPSGTG